jgi:tellurite methyltransferase
MPSQDAARWNERYRNETRYNTFREPRALLVDWAREIPTAGLALDAAMGLGGNAQFLLAHGLRVVGVDISWVALTKAHKRLPGLMTVQADLTEFYLPPVTFDLIANFYFLQRDLWPVYKKALKPGGWLFVETMTQAMTQVRPEIDPHYLLEPGELRQAFSDFEILDYHEGWQSSDGKHRRAIASLVARSLQVK